MVPTKWGMCRVQCWSHICSQQIQFGLTTRCNTEVQHIKTCSWWSWSESILMFRLIMNFVPMISTFSISSKTKDIYLMNKSWDSSFRFYFSPSLIKELMKGCGVWCNKVWVLFLTCVSPNISIIIHWLSPSDKHWYFCYPTLEFFNFLPPDKIAILNILCYWCWKILVFAS